MAWTVTLNGQSFNTDDMTLGELGDIEAATGKPWSLLNPWTDVATAREFARVALSRQGMEGDELAAAVAGLTARDVKSAFDFVEDEPMPKTEGEQLELPLDLSSRSSSRGARGGSGGGRAKQDKNVSAT
jgi:hypothetical protein